MSTKWENNNFNLKHLNHILHNIDYLYELDLPVFN